MVVERGFAVDAVGADLGDDLALEDGTSALAPGGRRVQLRQDGADDEQRQRLRDQMRVRAAVEREVRGDVPGLRHQRAEHARAQLRREPRATEHQWQHPQPREDPQRGLQRLEPVDADADRVLLDPAGELGGHFVRVTAVARHGRRRRQHREMLVPAGLPDDLEIEAAGARVRHPAPVPARPGGAG